MSVAAYIASQRTGHVDSRRRWEELAVFGETEPVRIGVVEVGGNDEVTVEEDVVLTGRSFDPVRVGELVRRVTAQDDALEHEYLPDRDRSRMSCTRDDWQQLCEADDLTVKRGRRVRVSLTGGRSRKVRIDDSDGSYLVTAEVAEREAVKQLADPYSHAWARNRRSCLVGFRIDEDGVLLAQGWTPEEGTTSEAFQTVLRAVAREADWYEIQLTGADRR